MQFDLDVHIITGELEAKFGFIGVSQCYDAPILICDIGGGSTELIYGQGDEMKALVSLDMGSVRGTEAFLRHDPPKADEITELKNTFKSMLKHALEDFGKIEYLYLVGIGGTATTMATIHQALEVYDSQRVHGYRLNKRDVQGILVQLLSMTLEQRKKLKGLEPKRSDIIIAGVCISEELVVCDKDNLEGAAVYLDKRKK